MTEQDKADTYTEAEAEARFDATLKTMLATPHKPHKQGRSEDRPSRSRKKQD